MRIPRPAHRFPGAAPLLFQAVGYAAAALPALVVTVAVLYGGLRGGIDAHSPGVIALDAAAAFAGVLASLLGNSVITFRSGVLFRGAALRRYMLSNLPGIAAHVALVVLLTAPRINPDSFNLPSVALATLPACAAQYALTFAILRLWGYRLAPLRDVERPIALSHATVTFDIELMSLAGGERIAGGLWSHRAFLAAYGGVLVAMLAYGWFGIVHLGIETGDGGARVIQAFQVVFGRHPHLGALGFVWPPLPSISDIPFLLFLQPLGHPLFAGTIMGSLYGAGAVVLFYAVLREAGAGRTFSVLLTVGLLLNEQFLQTSVAGLSEPVVACCLLASLLAFLKWMRDPRPGLVAAAGVATGFAILCRYEAAFWAAAMGAGVFIVLYGGIPGIPLLRRAGHAAETSISGAANHLLALVLPSGFALGVWMYLSAQIVGSPLYFLTGAGSTKASPDTAAHAGANLSVYGPSGEVVYRAYHSLAGTVALVLDRVGYFSPVLLVVTAILLLHVIRARDGRSLALLLVAWSIPAFGILTGYLGSLPPYTRYWYWTAPMGAVLAVYAMSLSKTRAVRLAAAPVVVAVMFMPVVRTFVDTYQAYGDQHPSAAQRWENALLTNSDFGSVASRQAATTELKRVARAVEQTAAPHDLVLLDVSTGGAIVMFARHPDRFVTSTDPDFRAPVLQEPWKWVQYIVAPQPTYDVTSRSLLYEAWPKVWDAGYSWVRVVDSVPGPRQWKLLATSATATTASTGAAAP